MKTEYIVIGLGALIAVVIVMRKSKGFFDEDNEDFRHGYYAGFFTPGPFTILAIAGALAVSI